MKIRRTGCPEASVNKHPHVLCNIAEELRPQCPSFAGRSADPITLRRLWSQEFRRDLRARYLTLF
jgi:hypothetical protein